jgi:hypothetical protein
MVVGLAMSIAGMFYLTQIEATSSYATDVLPAMIIISVGMAGVFIPASSTALVGVSGHDAGIASAVLNTSQQVGGSLGLALLNTLYAAAVTDYVTDNRLRPVETPFGLQPAPEALVHGYAVAFFWGAVLLSAALVVAATFINARKQDVPAEPALAAA